MQNFVLVQLPDCLDQLHELIPYFLFGEELIPTLAFLHQLTEVSPVSILHENQVLVLQFECPLLSDDVHVSQPLEDFNFFQHHFLYFSVFELYGLQGLVSVVFFLPYELHLPITTFSYLFL